MPGSSWLLGGLLAFGAVDLLALDGVVAPRALAPAEAPPPAAIARAVPPRAVDAPPPAPTAPPLAPTAPPLAPAAPPPAPKAPPPAVRDAPLSAAALRPVVVHFATDRAVLDVAALRALDRLAATLAADPRGTVEIVGHADLRGGERHNDLLSDRRMRRVRDYLAERGVAEARLRGRAAGAREPAQRGAGPAALAANRRAEVRRKP